LPKIFIDFTTSALREKAREKDQKKIKYIRNIDKWN